MSWENEEVISGPEILVLTIFLERVSRSIHPL